MSCNKAASRLFLACIIAFFVVSAANAQAKKSPEQLDLESVLNFESGTNGDFPAGWRGGPSTTIFVDTKVVHGGLKSARIERNGESTNGFSALTKSIPVDFTGQTIEIRGFLRTEDVSEFSGLWLREDSDDTSVAFNNMQSRQLKGTTEWTEYSVTLPLDTRAKQIFFGILQAGVGKTWADDLQLLVDGKSVWQAPHFERTKTPLDMDHEFDGGSRVSATRLSKVQIDNLVTLGKVWGFLKYYHPAVTSGRYHWDYELLRVLPTVLQAPDLENANAALVRWIDTLGPIQPCSSCVKLDHNNLYTAPDLGWIADTKVLGTELSQRLTSVRDNRSGKQFYVSQAPMVGNPVFDHELQYSGLKLPDFGYQLLAVYRFWNIVEYWSPYRDIIGKDWTNVLAEFIPRVALADTGDSYKRELLGMIAEVHDGHANLWSLLNVRPPDGNCSLPIRVRFLKNAPVITGNLASDSSDASQLKVGDVITSLSGVPVPKLVDEWRPYYAASNEAARLRAIAESLTRGACAETEIGVRRSAHTLDLKVKREAPPELPPATHDLPGPAFQLLSKDVAYLKLSSVKAKDCADYVQRAVGTKGFIIDIRNYPSEFVVFMLGSHLVNAETPFARFTTIDLLNPGAFHWTKPISVSPQQPHYSGKVVILVDENSMSQAEYTAMAFRAVPGAIVVGSTTDGADGNVSQFSLPEGIPTMISGLGVFYPDKTQTQRIGIIPNITVRPTVEGIRSGRDEVLEEAVREIVGPGTPAAEIEKMTHACASCRSASSQSSKP